MNIVSIKNGTPVGNSHLCQRCTWGHCITGYRESDQLVICMRNDPSFTIPFVVYECTEFNDKQKPTWEQMTKLAIHVTPRMSKKTRGFQATAVGESDGESEDEGFEFD